MMYSALTKETFNRDCQTLGLLKFHSEHGEHQLTYRSSVIYKKQVAVSDSSYSALEPFSNQRCVSATLDLPACMMQSPSPEVRMAANVITCTGGCG